MIIRCSWLVLRSSFCSGPAGSRFSKAPETLFGPVEPLQNLEPCRCRAVLFTYSKDEGRFPSCKKFQAYTLLRFKVQMMIKVNRARIIPESANLQSNRARKNIRSYGFTGPKLFHDSSPSIIRVRIRLSPSKSVKGLGNKSSTQVDWDQIG